MRLHCPDIFCMEQEPRALSEDYVTQCTTYYTCTLESNAHLHAIGPDRANDNPDLHSAV